jgi:hypothetical protein
MSKLTLARGAVTGSSTAPAADDLLLELVSVGDVPTNVIIYWPRPPSVVRVTDFREACDNIAGVLDAAIAKLATIKDSRPLWSCP